MSIGTSYVARSWWMSEANWAAEVPWVHTIGTWSLPSMPSTAVPWVTS